MFLFFLQLNRLHSERLALNSAVCSRGHGDYHKAKHHKHNKVKKMLNGQSSFSTHSFSLKPIEQSSTTASWPSNDPSSQSFSSSSSQHAVASLPPLQIPNLNGSINDAVSRPLSYMQNRTAEDLQVIRETAQGYVTELLLHILYSRSGI